MRLALLLLSLLSPAARAAPLRVLVTAFEPYDGRKENGSEGVAKKLAALSAAGGVEFQTCVLPVEFDRAAERALACYAALSPKPDMVLSLGESLCDTEIEVSANNMAIDLAKGDARGVKKFGPIAPGQPETELLTLPVAEMFCATGAKLKADINASNLKVSASPGYFVCNDVTYRLARHFKPRNVPFGFIHVPAPGRCSLPFAPEKTAAQIRTMALAAAHELSGRQGGALPVSCENEGIARELLDLEKNMGEACRAVVRQAIAREEKEERKRRAELTKPAPPRPAEQSLDSERIEY